MRRVGFCSSLLCIDVDVPHPDEKSIITYVSSLYDVMPRVPDVQDGVQANELELRWQEYYELVTMLLQWIRHHVVVFEERKFPTSYEEIEVLWRQFLKFKETELPAKEADKNRSKLIYKAFEGSVQAGQIKVPPGYHPIDVEKEWGRLHVAILERERLLRTEFERAGPSSQDRLSCAPEKGASVVVRDRETERQRESVRSEAVLWSICGGLAMAFVNYTHGLEYLLGQKRALERLQRTVSKVQMESGVCEEQLNQVETLLQTDMRSLGAGKPIQHAAEIEADLDKAENMIRFLFNDVQLLKDGRHLQAEQMYRRVYRLHERLVNLRSEYNLRLKSGVTVSQVPLTSTSVGQTLQQSPQRVRPELDEVTLRYIQDLLAWVEENQRRIDTSDWGADLPAVESQLGSHRGLHQSIEDFKSKIDRARADESFISGHRTLPTGRCPQDGAHRTLPTGRCPQDAAHRTLDDFSPAVTLFSGAVCDPLTSTTHANTPRQCHCSAENDPPPTYYLFCGGPVVVLWGSCPLKNRVIQYTEKQMDYSLDLYTYRVSYMLRPLAPHCINSLLVSTQLTPASKGAYRDYLGKLDLQYGKLLNSSKTRLRSLTQLHAFVVAATKELMWLNEKEEEEVNYDWSDRNTNMTAKKDNYSGLMRELEHREKRVNTVQATGDKLLKEGHPARSTAFMAALQTQWSWMLQLCCCIETHLKENTSYFQFFADVKEAEEKMKKMQETMKKKYICDRSITVTRLEDLLQDAADEEAVDSSPQFKTHLDGLNRRAKTIIQLKPRNPANCDSGITVHRGDECGLLNNSQPSKWKVRSSSGSEAMVPSICFIVPPTNKEAVDSTSGLDSSLQKLMVLWQKLHVDMKSLLSWQYLMRDIQYINSWNFIMFKTLKVEEYRQALKNLEQHYQVFMRDSQDSDLFGPDDRMQVESSYSKATQHYDNLLRSVEQGEQDESVCKSYITQIKDLRLRLEGCESRMVSRLRQPVDKEPLKACAQRTTEQKKLQTELDGIKKDLDVVVKQSEAALASSQQSSSAPVLRSELDITQKKMEHVYSLSSVYLDKLKTIDLVIRSTEGAEDLLRRYENQLRDVHKVPADEKEVEACLAQLKKLHSEAQGDQPAFDRLDAELQEAVAVNERMSRVHKERDAELDHYRQLVASLKERWQAVFVQMELRQRELDLLGKQMQAYRQSYEWLIRWTDDAKQRQEKIQAVPIGDTKALQEQLNQEKKLLQEIEKNKDKVDECQKYAKGYIDAVKDYELQLVTYKALVEPIASPLKKTKLESASDNIIQEYVTLRTRYSELMTLTSQYIKFILETQRRLEDEEKATEKLKEEERRKMAEMQAELEKQRQLAESHAKAIDTRRGNNPTLRRPRSSAEADRLRKAAQEEAEKLRKQVNEETQKKRKAEEELKQKSEAEKEAAKQKQKALEDLERFKQQAEEAERRMKQAELEKDRQIKVAEEVAQKTAATTLESKRMSFNEKTTKLEESLKQEQGTVIQLQEEAERLKKQQAEADKAREEAEKELEVWRQKANEALRLRLQAEEEAHKKSAAQEEAEKQKEEAKREAKKRGKAEELALKQKEAAEKELERQRKDAEETAQQKLLAEQELIRLRSDFDHAEQQRTLLDDELQRLKNEVNSAVKQKEQLEEELSKVRQEMEVLIRLKSQAEKETMSNTEKSKQLLESEATKMRELAEEAAKLRAVAEEAKKQRKVAEDEAAHQRAEAEKILKEKLAAINEATRLKTEAEIALKEKEAENDRLKRKAEDEAYQRKVLEDQAAQHKQDIEEKIGQLKKSSDGELERQKKIVEETLKQKKVVEEEIHILKINFEKASTGKQDLELELNKLKSIADETQKSKVQAEEEAEKFRKLALEEEKKRKEAEDKVKKIAAAEEEAARQCQAAQQEAERLRKKAEEAKQQKDNADKEAEKQIVLAQEAAQKCTAAEQKAQNVLVQQKEDSLAQTKLKEDFEKAKKLAEDAEKAKQKAEEEAALLRQKADEAERQKQAAEAEAAKQAKAQEEAEKLRKEAEKEASKRAKAEAAALKQKKQADAEMAKHKDLAETTLKQKSVVEEELIKVKLQLEDTDKQKSVLDEELTRLKNEVTDAVNQKGQVEGELSKVKSQMEELLKLKVKIEEENQRLMNKDQENTKKLLEEEAENMKKLAEEAARLSADAQEAARLRQIAESDLAQQRDLAEKMLKEKMQAIQEASKLKAEAENLQKQKDQAQEEAQKLLEAKQEMQQRLEQETEGFQKSLEAERKRQQEVTAEAEKLRLRVEELSKAQSKAEEEAKKFKNQAEEIRTRLLNTEQQTLEKVTVVEKLEVERLQSTKEADDLRKAIAALEQEKEKLKKESQDLQTKAKEMASAQEEQILKEKTVLQQTFLTEKEALVKQEKAIEAEKKKLEKQLDDEVKKAKALKDEQEHQRKQMEEEKKKLQAILDAAVKKQKDAEEEMLNKQKEMDELEKKKQEQEKLMGEENKKLREKLQQLQGTQKPAPCQTKEIEIQTDQVPEDELVTATVQVTTKKEMNGSADVDGVKANGDSPLSFDGIREKVPARRLNEVGVLSKKEFDKLKKGKTTVQELSKLDKVKACLKGKDCISGILVEPNQKMSIYEALKEKKISPDTAAMLLEAQAASGYIIDPLKNRRLSVNEAVKESIIGPELHTSLLSAERAATGFKDPFTGQKISLFEAMKKGLVTEDQATKLLDVQIATGGVIDPVNGHRVPVQTACKQGQLDEELNKVLSSPPDDRKAFRDPNTQEILTYDQLLSRCKPDPDTGLPFLPVTETALVTERTYTEEEAKDMFSKTNVSVPFGKFKGKTVTIWEVINSEYFTEEQRKELIRQYRSGKITVEKIIRIVITVVEDKEKTKEPAFDGLRSSVPASELLESKVINKDLFNKLHNGKASVKEVSEMEPVKKALKGTNSIAGVFIESTKEKMPIYEAMKKNMLGEETAQQLLEAQAGTGFIIDPVKNQKLTVDDAVKAGIVGPELHEKLLSAERAACGYKDPYTGKTASVFEAMQKDLINKDQGIRLLEAQLETGGIIDPVKSYRVPPDVAYKRGYFSEDMNKDLSSPSDTSKVFVDPNSKENVSYAQLQKQCITDKETGLLLLPLSEKAVKATESDVILDVQTKEALNKAMLELDSGPFKGRKVTIWEIINSEYLTEEQRIDIIRQYRSGTVTIERIIKIVITLVEEREMKKQLDTFSGLRGPVTASSLFESKIIDKATYDQLQQGKKKPQEISENDSVRRYLRGSETIAGAFDEKSKEKLSIYQAMKQKLLTQDTGLALLEAQAATGFIVDPVRNQKFTVDDAVKAGLVGPELHEKLLSAEKAVTGYKDPYTGNKISLFQAMQKQLVLREHAIPLLEAQEATGGIVDPVNNHRVPTDIAIQRGYLNKQLAKSFKDPSEDVKGFTDPNKEESTTYRQLIDRCMKDPESGAFLLSLSKPEVPKEPEKTYVYTEEQAQTDLASTQIDVPHNVFAGKQMSLWDVMASDMLPEDDKRRLLQQFRSGKITKERMIFIIIEIIEQREIIKTEQSMLCDVIRRRVTIEELYSSRIIDLETYNLLKQGKKTIREVMEMPTVKRYLFGTGSIAGVLSDSYAKVSIYNAMKRSLIKPDVAIDLLEAQAATGFMVDPVKHELLTVDEAVRKGLVGPELHDKLLSAERAVTGYRDPYSGKVISLYQAMKKDLVPEDYALKLIEAQIATGGLMDPEYSFHLPADVAMQRGYINKETSERLSDGDVKGFVDPTTDEKLSYSQLLNRCKVDKESGLHLLSLADKRLLFQGLRKQITIEELLRSQIIDQKTYNELTEGIISVEDVMKDLKKYLEGTSCIAGVYVEASKDRLSIYQAMKKNMIRPGTAFELLEAQAATGYVIDPIKNLKLTVAEAVKLGVVGPEFKDKLLSAERAVTGYKDPYSGKVISLFQAMKKGLILKDHGVRLLEAQIATGGIIDPEESHRLPVEMAYKRGLFDEEMNSILTDPSDDTKGFFDPNTEENLTYLQLMERCMTDPETGLALLLLKEKKRERKTSSKSSVRKRRVVIVDPETGKEMSVYEAYRKGLIDHQTYLELAEQECEWEEITISSSDGVVKSMIIDRRSGRQYDIDDAITKGLIDQSALDQYRAGTLSITEFADMLSGNMSGFRSRSSSFGSTSSFPMSPTPAIRTPATTWNDPTEETGPVAGILDTDTLEKVSVTEAMHRNLVDNITGQRLLEAQACTGGIIDPNTGEKFTVADATNKGLVDKIMVDRINLAQKAYQGFEDPRTKTKMSAAQALKKGWLYYEAGQRFLEVQYLTGGLIEPEVTGRVALDEAVKKGTLDARTAQKLRDVSGYSKYLTCPKTKLKISYKDAMERSMVEEGSGLRLLEASSQSSKGLYSPYSISGSGSTSGSRQQGHHSSSAAEQEEARVYAFQENRMQIPTNQVPERPGDLPSDCACTDSRGPIRAFWTLINQEGLKEHQQNMPAQENGHARGAVAGVFLETKNETITIYQAFKKRLLKSGTCLALLEAQAATEGIIDPNKNRKLSVEDAVKEGIVGPEMKDKLQSAEQARKGYADPYTDQPISLFQAIQKDMIPKDYGIRLLEAQILTTGVYDPVEGCHISEEKACERGHYEKGIFTDQVDELRVFYDPNSREKLSYQDLVQKCKVDSQTGLLLFPVYITFKGLRKGVTSNELLASKIIDQKTYDDLHEGRTTTKDVMLLETVKEYLEGKGSIGGVAVFPSNEKMSIYQAMRKGIIMPGTALILLEAQAATGFVIDPVENKKFSVDEALKNKLVGPEYHAKLLAAERAVTGYKDPYTDQTISLFQALSKDLMVKEHGIRLLEAQIATGGIIDPINSHRLPVDVAYKRGFFDENMNAILEDSGDDTKGFFDPNTKENLTYLQLINRCVIDPATGLTLLPLYQGNGGPSHNFIDYHTKVTFKDTMVKVTCGRYKGLTVSLWELLMSEYFTEAQRQDVFQQYKKGSRTIQMIITYVLEVIERSEKTTDFTFKGIRERVTADQLADADIITKKDLEEIKAGKLTVEDIKEDESIQIYLQGKTSIAGVLLPGSQIMSIYQASRKGVLRPGTSLILLEAQAATGFIIDPIANQKFSVDEAVKARVVGPELHAKLLSAERAVTGYKDPYTDKTISLFQAMQKDLIVKDHGIRLLEAQIATGGIIDPVNSHRIPVHIAYQRGYFDVQMNQILDDPTDDTKGFFDPNTHENLTYLQLMDRCVTDPSTGLRLLPIKGKEKRVKIQEGIRETFQTMYVTVRYGRFSNKKVTLWDLINSEYLSEEKRQELMHRYTLKTITTEEITTIILEIIEKKEILRNTDFYIKGLRKNVSVLDLLKLKVIDEKTYKNLLEGKITLKDVLQIASVRNYVQGTSSIAGVILKPSGQKMSIYEAKKKGLLTPGTGLCLLEAQAATGFIMDPIQSQKLTVEESLKQKLIGPELYEKLLAAEGAVSGYKDPYTGEKLSLFQAMKKELILHQHGIRLLEAQIATGGIIDPLTSVHIPLEVAYNKGYFDEDINQILLDPSDDTKGFFDPNTTENLTYKEMITRCIQDPDTGFLLLPLTEKGKAQQETGNILSDEEIKKDFEKTTVSISVGRFAGKTLSLWELIHSEYFTEEQRQTIIEKYRSRLTKLQDIVTTALTTIAKLEQRKATQTTMGLRKPVTVQQLVDYGIIEASTQQDLQDGKTTLEQVLKQESVQRYLKGTGSIAGVQIRPSERILSIHEAKTKGQLSPDMALILLEAEAATGFVIDPIKNKYLCVEEAAKDQLIGPDLLEHLLLAEQAVTGFTDPYTGEKIGVLEAIKKDLIPRNHGLRLLEAQLATGGVIDPVLSHRLPDSQAIKRGCLDKEVSQLLANPGEDGKWYSDPSTKGNLTYHQLRETCVKNASTGLLLLPVPENNERSTYTDEQVKAALKAKSLINVGGKFEGLRVSLWDVLMSEYITAKKREQLLEQYKLGKLTLEELIEMVTAIIIEVTTKRHSFKGLRKQVSASQLFESKIISKEMLAKIINDEVTDDEINKTESIQKFLGATNCIAGVRVESTKQILSIYEAKSKGLLTPGTSLVLLEAQAATGFMIDPVKNKKLSVDEAVAQGVVGAEWKNKLLSAERAVTGYNDPYTGNTISLFQALKKDLIVQDHGIRLLEAQIATGGIIDPVHSHRVPVEVAYQRGYFDEEMNQILSDPTDDTKGFFDPNTQENLTYMQLVERCVQDPETGLSLLVIVKKGEFYFFIDEHTKKILKSTTTNKAGGKFQGQVVSLWDLLHSQYITEEKRRDLVQKFKSGTITIEVFLEHVLTIIQQKSPSSTITTTITATTTTTTETKAPQTFQGIKKDVTAKELLDSKIISEKLYDDLNAGKITTDHVSKLDFVRKYLQGTDCIAGVYVQSTKQTMSIYEAKSKGLLTPGTSLVLLEAQAATGFMIDPVKNKKLSVEEAAAQGVVGAEWKNKLLSAERAVTGYTDPNTGNTISLFQALKKDLIVQDHGIRLLEAQIATGGIIDPVHSHRVPVEVAYQRGYFDEEMNQILSDPTDDTKGFFDPNTQENLTYLQLVERCIKDPETGLSLLVIVKKGEFYFFIDEHTKKILKSTTTNKAGGKFQGQVVSLWDLLHSQYITEEKRRDLVQKFKSGTITIEVFLEHVLKIIQQKSPSSTITTTITATTTTTTETKAPQTFQGIKKDVTAKELLDSKIISEKLYDDLNAGKITTDHISKLDFVRKYLQGTDCIAGVYVQSTKQTMSIYEAKSKGLLTPGTSLVLLEAQAATGFMIDPVKNKKLSVEEAAAQGVVGAEWKSKLLSAERAVTGYTDPNTGNTISLFQALKKDLIVQDHGIRLLEAQIATGGIIDPVHSHRVPVEVAYQRGYFDEEMNQILSDPTDDTKGFFDPNTQENLTYLQLVERCIKDPETGLSLLVIVKKGEFYFFIDEHTKKILKSTTTNKAGGKFHGEVVSLWDLLHSQYITEEKRRDLVQKFKSGTITIEVFLEHVLTIIQQKSPSSTITTTITATTTTTTTETKAPQTFQGIKKDVTAKELLDSKIISEKLYDDLNAGKITTDHVSKLDFVRKYLQGTDCIAGVYVQSTKQTMSIYEAKSKGLLTPGTSLVLLEAQAATGFMIDPVKNKKLSVEEAAAAQGS
ncbi:hypothetical protein NFI96_019042 [Prochilodus magdalenae]|nr:hypothetical protein NFI96_019042 [Prochilodus magdalenae]